MVNIIEMCFYHGWITTFSCQGGIMWPRRAVSPAYVAFAQQDHLAFIDHVSQYLPESSLAVIGGSVPAVYFEPAMISEIERALTQS